MNLAKDALHILTSMAPTAATMLAGPFAGFAVSKLEEAFGVAGKADSQQQIEQAITSGNPDALVKLKQVEADVTTKMAELGIQREKLSYDDTANARAREMAVKDRIPGILAGLVVLLTFALEGSLLMGWHQPAKVSGEILGRILGTLDSATILVLSYYFGSSATSRAKDDTINTLSKS